MAEKPLEVPASDTIKDKRFLKQSVYEMEAFVLPNERRRKKRLSTEDGGSDLVDAAQEIISESGKSSRSVSIDSPDNAQRAATQSIYEMQPFVISGEFAAQVNTTGFTGPQVPKPNFEGGSDILIPEDQPPRVVSGGNQATLELSTGLPDQRIGIHVGQYEIVDVIGRGNMAVVYKARHTHTGEIVALKTHKSDADKSQKVRFAREIETHARLAHTNIVQFIHALDGPDGQKYLAIENVRGLSLQAVLETHGPIQHPLNIWSIFSQICDALDHAHGRGIIHRDLKPGNVILSKKSGERIQVKLADFGIAHDETELARLTQEGSSIGSPLYMSPEQCQGFDLTPRSDVYSLGILMTEIVSGVCPYRGKSIMSIIRAHCNPMTRPEPLSTICPDLPCVEELESILGKALETEEDRRFKSVQELKGAISDWFDNCCKAASGERPIMVRRAQVESDKGTTGDATVPASSTPEVSLKAAGSPPAARSMSKTWIVILILLFIISNAVTAYFVFTLNKQNSGNQVQSNELTEFR